MSHEYKKRHVINEDRRDLLKALGVAGAVTVGGATMGEIREEMGQSFATTELASIGEAIKSDLAGQLEAGLITSQQAELSTAATGLSVALERGIPEAAPREEFVTVAEAGRPLYEHLTEVGFFESTTSHLPAFEPSYLSNAVSVFVGSKALAGTLDEFEFVGGQAVDVLATVIGNAQQLSDHWVSTDQIAREELEYGEYIPPMTKAAAGGVLLWLEDLDQHLWNQEVLMTEEILADAVWHGQAMAAGFQLMAEGARAIATEDATLSDTELSGVLSTGFAVQAISQELLPADAYWITEEMRDDRRTDLRRVTH